MEKYEVGDWVIITEIGWGSGKINAIGQILKISGQNYKIKYLDNHIDNSVWKDGFRHALPHEIPVEHKKEKDLLKTLVIW